MTELINNKIEKIHASSYDSSLRRYPSEVAEVRNVLNNASKTLPGHKIYFENMIEKAGFSTFSSIRHSIFLSIFWRLLK